MILYLKCFVNCKKWFGFLELHKKIVLFKYKGFDRNNVPCEVDSLKEKLSGNAVQNCTFIRLLPLLIGDKIVDPSDDVWQQIMRLRDIVEFVCAPSIAEWQIAYLKVIIEQYIEYRARLFPEHNLKPKHHYLLHYPSLIMQFGPLIRVWTMRFESKHSYFKRCVRSARCFKNVCYTMADRHQLLQAFKCSGLFFHSALQLSNSLPFQLDCYSDALQNIIKPWFHEFKFPLQVSDEVMYNGITYKKGDFIAYSQSSSEIMFGEIWFIVCSDNCKLFFVIRSCHALYSSDLHLHIVAPCSDTPIDKWFCVEKNELLDYQPLSSYNMNQLVMIPLKYSIPSREVY